MEPGTILLRGLRAHAFHGCLPEEAVVGGTYEVDLDVHLDMGPSRRSDHLADTVDYSLLQRCLREELLQRSALIEHVAGRMVQRLFAEEPRILWLRLELRKINPPIDGDVDYVAIVLERDRPHTAVSQVPEQGS
ncbi:dihydroneopterin aldolase [bacterium]|nr:dihydroneopterin aldolase [bacterium]